MRVMLFVHCRAMFHSTEVPNLNITVSCQQYSSLSATVRTVPEAFRFGAVQYVCVFRDHIQRLLTVHLINRGVNRITCWSQGVMSLPHKCQSLSPPLDNIRVMVIVWKLRGNVIRTAPCWVVWHNVHSQQHTHVSSSYPLAKSPIVLL